MTDERKFWQRIFERRRRRSPGARFYVKHDAESMQDWVVRSSHRADAANDRAMLRRLKALRAYL